MHTSPGLLAELKSLLLTRDDEKIIAFLREQPKALTEKDENGTSGLMLIAYHGLSNVKPIAQALVPNIGFYESIAYGLLENVQEELAAKTSLLNQAAPDGFSPLCLASYFGQFEVAQWLVEQGADVNQAAANPSKVAPIHAAVAANHPGLVDLLIAKGADVNLRQTQGVTPLQSAAHRGNLEIVKSLVEAGAEIEAAMDSGETALDYAKKDGHQAVVDYLHSQK